MAMNIHNLDEMVEDFNKQEKKIKEVMNSFHQQIKHWIL